MQSPGLSPGHGCSASIHCVPGTALGAGKTAAPRGISWLGAAVCSHAEGEIPSTSQAPSLVWGPPGRALVGADSTLLWAALQGSPVCLPSVRALIAKGGTGGGVEGQRAGWEERGREFQRSRGSISYRLRTPTEQRPLLHCSPGYLDSVFN